MNLGSKELTRVHLGSKEITRIHLGNKEIYSGKEIYTIFSDDVFSNCTPTLNNWILDTTFHLYSQVVINYAGTVTSNSCKVIFADNVKRVKRVHLVGKLYGSTNNGATVSAKLNFIDSNGTQTIASGTILASYTEIPFDIYVDVDKISEFTLSGTMSTSLSGIAQSFIAQITDIEALNY